MSSIKGEKVCIVRDRNENAESIDATIAFGDLRDKAFVDRVVVQYDPEVVVHLAASAIVNQGLKNPIEMYSSNFIGTLNLINGCRKLEKKDLFFQFLSTDKVLGNQIDSRENAVIPFVELGPYEQSKAFAEVLCLTWANAISISVTRSCNIYGPGDTHSRIIPNTIRQCLDGENPIVFKEEDPSTRQYVFIDDLVEAMRLMRENRLKGIYHVGTPDILTQTDVVNTIIDAVGDRLEPRIVTDDPRVRQYLWYIHRQSLNYDRMMSLGWKPRVSFRDGIRQTVDWWKKRQSARAQ
jgi:dTDP-glucose 4,6-dehydratase